MKPYSEILPELEAFEAIDTVFADFLARRCGAGFPEELYLAAALASRAVREGHSCCLLPLVAGQPLSSETKVTAPPLDRWLTVLRDPAHQCWVAAPQGDPTAPLALDDCNRLYLRRYLDCERTVARHIADRVGRPPTVPQLVPGRMSGLLPYFAANSRRPVTDFQQLAVFTALCNAFSVITGGPGTGKTTVVSALLALELERDPDLSIVLCAPTGKAQARLAESMIEGIARLRLDDGLRQKLTGLESLTVHKLLGVNPRTQTTRFHAGNPLPVDLLIVDESSMMPLTLMARLLDALRPEARILLLGDKDQLASVEAGAVLSDLCESAAINTLQPAAAAGFATATGWQVPPADQQPLSGAVAALTVNHRFAAAERIGRFSAAMRTLTDGDETQLSRQIATADFPDFQTRNPARSDWESALAEHLHRPVWEGYAMSDLQRLAAEGSPEARDIAFGILGSFQILAAMRQGRRGVRGLNEAAARLLGHHGEYPPGQPLMILRNDGRTGLSNGDTGVVWPDQERPGRVRVHFRHLPGSFTPQELPEHEPVYAMTVHKSQGSGFRNVLLVLPDEFNPVVTRELLYTGITRAEARVDLWADEAIIARALANRTVRQSGLGDRLKEQLAEQEDG